MAERAAATCAVLVVLLGSVAAAQPFVPEGADIPVLNVVAAGRMADTAFSQPADANESELARSLVEGGLAALLGDREAITRAVNSYVERDSGWAFLKDVNFRLKTFHQDSAEGREDETSLGFSYDYRKELLGHALPAAGFATHRGLDLRFETRGNVAFERAKNPEDFLESAFSAAFFQSTGGASELDPEAQARYRLLRDASSCAVQMDAVFCRGRVDAFRDAGLCVDAECGALRDKEQVKRLAYALIGEGLSDQVALSAALDLGFETDQSFDAQQFVYGGHVGLAVNGWAALGAERFEEVRGWSRWNVLDYPFALARWATGTTEGFAPSALGFPSLVVALALVDPENDDDPRSQVGDTSSFTRLYAETSYKTLLFDARRFETLAFLGLVHFGASYRYWQELSPRDVVEDAGLDDFHYWVLTLGSASGVFFSYSQGELPFDSTSDRLYQLGFQFHF